MQRASEKPVAAAMPIPCHIELVGSSFSARRKILEISFSGCSGSHFSSVIETAYLISSP